jgi:hypothetical protein
MSEKRFIKGVWINEHTFPSGDILLNVDFVQEDFSPEFKELVEDGRLRLTFKKSQGGKWYAEQNTFKPSSDPKPEASSEVIKPSAVTEPGAQDDLPF